MNRVLAAAAVLALLALVVLSGVGFYGDHAERVRVLTGERDAVANELDETRVALRATADQREVAKAALTEALANVAALKGQLARAIAEQEGIQIRTAELADLRFRTEQFEKTEAWLTKSIARRDERIAQMARHIQALKDSK